MSFLQVGRTLVREIALRQLRHDITGIESLTNDVKLLAAAMLASQCRLGGETAILALRRRYSDMTA